MNNSNRLLYLLAAVKLVLPFVLQNGVYEPHRDELLYLAEGHHMAWGFMEVPPLLSVFAWLTHLLGDGMFWIKLWPSLFGALTYLITGRIILLLGGRSYALFLGFLPFALGGYLRVHYLFQPNFLEIFFWTMIAWSLICFVKTSGNQWLYVLGLSAGLGMMSKYSVLFYITAVCLGLLLTRERKIFANRHLYMAGLIALVICLPNFWWQYRLHFPVVYHMEKLQRTQLQYISPVSFLLDQFIMFLPVFFIWPAGLLYVFLAPAARPYRFIGWAYLAVIILLLLGRGKNYYALGAYPVLFAFGAFALEELTRQRLRWLRYVFILVPLWLGYTFVYVALPLLPPDRLAAYYRQHDTQKLGLLKWEDGNNHPLPQDFSDMQGWEEMTAKMALAYNQLDSAEKKKALLFCDNYGEAGALNFYGPKYHLPETYSDDASFLYWIPDSLHFDNLVLLTPDTLEMEHPFIKNFAYAKLVGRVTSPYARQRGDLIILLKGANGDFKKMFIDKLEKDKSMVNFH